MWAFLAAGIDRARVEVYRDGQTNRTGLPTCLCAVSLANVSIAHSASRAFVLLLRGANAAGTDHPPMIEPPFGSRAFTDRCTPVYVRLLMSELRSRMSTCPCFSRLRL